MILCLPGPPGLQLETGLEAEEFIVSGIPVDVMFLDIRMPGKSGLDVVRDTSGLRILSGVSQCASTLSTPGNRRGYPIIATTGHVDCDAQQEFRSVVDLVFKLCWYQPECLPLNSYGGMRGVPKLKTRNQ